MDRIYIANLPPNIRIMDIDDFFRPFGKLISIDVNHRANPVYAYVQFDSPRNAFNAVKSRHGYNYEGYTLLLRLAENEVRTRRDATPPPPPPPMFETFDRQNNDGVLNNRMGGNFSSSSFQSSSQWSNNIRSGIQQYPSSNRPNMLHQDIGYSANNQEQNLVPYSNSGRSNIQQQYSNANFSNMQEQYSNTNISNIQQKYSNANLSNMQQQYSNSYRSNIQDQFSNSNRSDMSTQNMYSNRSDIPQQNINFSRDDRFNRPEQEQNLGMMRFSNNSAWNSNNMNWNSGNGSNNNGGPNVLNQYSDPYAQSDSDDHYTQGLSGSGRKWFNRYISQGFSKEMARKKALEHRTLPYLREGRNKNPTDHPTNAALQTIGSTLISLLSNNTNDGSSSNFQIPGPSSSKPMTRQNPNKTISTPGNKNKNKQIVPKLSEAELWDKFTKKKEALMIEAVNIFKGKNRNSKKTRFKKQARMLINDLAISEIESRTLCFHDKKKLKELILLKQKYDMVALKPNFIEGDKKSEQQAIYQKDLKYISMYEYIRTSKLYPDVRNKLCQCINRIHNYEQENKIPQTYNTLIKLLLRNKKENNYRPNVLQLTCKNKSITYEKEKDNGTPKFVEQKSQAVEKVESNVANENETNSLTEKQHDGNTNGKNSSKIKGNIPSRLLYRYKGALHALRRLKPKIVLTAEDLKTKHDSMKVIKQYQRYIKVMRSHKPTSNDSEHSQMLNKKKEDTRKFAGKNFKSGEAYKERKQMLINEAGKRIDLKKSNMREMKTKPVPVTSDISSSMMTNYLNDIKYMALHEHHKLSKLTWELSADLRKCITRIVSFEREHRLPRTRSKFIRLLRPKLATDANAGEKPKEKVEKNIENSGDNEENKNISNNNQENKNIIGEQHEEIIDMNADFHNDEKISENNCEKEQHIENVEGKGDIGDNENITEDNSKKENIIEEQHENIEDNEDNWGEWEDD